MQKIHTWDEDDANESFFFRPAATSDSARDGELDTFLLVHQEGWQKRLLQLYGNTMCLLDATYKTTKYAVAFFMLVVNTNVGYIPVADFVIEEENAESIKEALAIIQHWNREWNPQYMMVDYSESEMNAIKDLFPSISIHVCSFHREQAWERLFRTGMYVGHPISSATSLISWRLLDTIFFL